MNKDLEKIIHETAREIAKVLAVKVEPYDQKIDATLKSITKMSASMAINLHTETQKLIDDGLKIEWELLNIGNNVRIKVDGEWGSYVVNAINNDGSIDFAYHDNSQPGITAFNSDIAWHMHGYDRK